MGNSYDIKLRSISKNLVHLYDIFLDLMFLRDPSFTDFIQDCSAPFDPATLTSDISYHYLNNCITELVTYVSWESKFMLVMEYYYCNESRYLYFVDATSKKYSDVQFIEKAIGDETYVKVYN